MKKANVMLLGVMVALMVPMFFAPTVSAQTDNSLTKVLNAGKIVVGIEAAYPPFEQRNPTTDKIEGFDPDIIEFVAADMGVTVEYKDVAWDTIFTGLAAGDYDVICSAVSITDTRKETMDFSRWYYKSTQAVMVNDKNPKNITSVEDINKTRTKIGVQAGTASEWYIDDEGIIGTKVTYKTITLAIEALKSGRVDVVLGDYATLAAGKTANSTSLAIIDTYSPEDFGIPAKKGSTALISRINVALEKLVGTDPQSPVFSQNYTASYVKWFGVAPATEFALDAVPPPTPVKIDGFPSYGFRSEKS
jgi:ABC-type amino acid transport substrate-binding protein